MISKFEFRGETFEYEIVFSNRKTLQLEVNPDSTILVRAPLKCPHSFIENFIREKSAWIFEKTKLMEQKSAAKKRREFTEGSKHLFLGDFYELKLIKGAIIDVFIENDKIVISSPKELSEESIESILYQWYTYRANEHFIDSLRRCIKIFPRDKHPIPIIKIKKMRTRWGSMSTSGNMSLNIELIRASEKCIDYVVMHELCHLIHQNHGAGFYQLQESLVPDWKELKFELNKLISENS